MFPWSFSWLLYLYPANMLFYLQTWNYYVSEHIERFKQYKKNDNDDGVVRNDSAYMFDAIWTAALALNRTATRLKTRNLTLLDFNYDDKHGISDMIYEEALNVTFFGLTVSDNCMYTAYIDV